MDLFQSVDIKTLPGTPLPEKLRPQDFQDLVGQKKAIEQIKRYIESGFLPNLILWGPPGTGKTSFARLLSKYFDCDFVAINAVQSGVKELKEISESAKKKRIEFHRRTLLFVDEVHRFNKSQQDVLLPFIESGDVTLIGATTENPSYELNKAILSRSRLIVFEKIKHEELFVLMKKAAENHGYEITQIISSEAREWLQSWADGDARKLFLALEEIFSEISLLKKRNKNEFNNQFNSELKSNNTELNNDEQMKPLTKENLQALLGRLVIGHDKSSDSHYDLISAMIKSIRGSDADAALYYLGRLVKGGEDPIFIARRLVILASEDVGNADPRAIQVAISCAQAVEMIGMPEGGINLAQAVTYLSSAPKSNRSYSGYKKALQLVEQTGSLPVPLKLRSSQSVNMKELGYGQDYQYPHDFPRHWVEQRYLPVEINLQQKLYQPSEIGFEKQITEYANWLKGK